MIRLMLLDSRSYKAAAIAGLMAVSMVGTLATAQSAKAVSIRISGMDYLAEDDPLSSDEPYLITIGFRFQLTPGQGGSATVASGTVSVQNVGSGPHNNLGHSSDNWASKGKNYWWDLVAAPGLPPMIGNGPMEFVAELPPNQPGWVVGTVVVFMEEDGFSNSTAGTLRNRIRGEVDKSIRSLSFQGFDPKVISDALIKKVMSDLDRSVRNFDIGGIIRSLASAVDPDDFGGVNVVMAMTVPNGINIFSGQPPADLSKMNLTFLRTQAPPTITRHEFSLMYPAGDLSKIPHNARYTGRARIKGAVLQRN
jgi:hypothetical protein